MQYSAELDLQIGLMLHVQEPRPLDACLSPTHTIFCDRPHNNPHTLISRPWLTGTRTQRLTGWLVGSLQDLTTF